VYKFVTTGMKPSAGVLRAGASAVMMQAGDVEITARYEVEARSSFTNQNFSVNLRKPF
jgi:hypothetical protein